MFHSAMNGLSESHGVSSGGDGTDVVLVFVDVVLPVAAGVDVRDVVDAGADGSLIDPSR